MVEKLDLKEYEELFNTITYNSSKERNKKNEQRIKEEEYRLKKEKKDKFKNRMTILVALVLVFVAMVASLPTIKDKVNRELELQRVNQYVSSYIDSSIDIEKVVLSDGTVVPLDNSSSTYKMIADELQNKLGLSRDCAIYCISKKYGAEAFNILVVEYGYKNSEDFLDECYSVATEISSSGLTSYGTKGSYEYFENAVQTELVEKVRAFELGTVIPLDEKGGMKL